MTSFSLFEGDILSRVFLRLGIRAKGAGHIAARIVFVWLLTAVPTGLLAWYQGFTGDQPRPLNFFGDVASLGQALVGYPLFIIAEWLIGEKTRSAAEHFEHSGVLLHESLETLHELHAKIARFRHWWVPEACCAALAYIFAFGWMHEEMHNSYDTWHAIGAPAVQHPTLAGWWLVFLGVPVFNFWWIRWMLKIDMWCWYLYKVSRLRLHLLPTHPDKTGGLGFLSEAQSSFAIVIFAFGVGCVAPLVGYKLEIEHSELLSFSVGGPLIGFVVGAPLFFTLPLLMFTKQLFRAKKRVVEVYQNRATEAVEEFEEKLFDEDGTKSKDLLFSPLIGGLNNIHGLFRNIEEMRVVPFDLRSFSQLLGSTFGSLLPLVVKLADLPEPTVKFLEMLKPFLGGGGEH
ncbi:MAG: hypothetical protein U0136_19530 [Bdellovibrionota bacterium]